MSSVPVLGPREPRSPLPDVRIYPVGDIRPVASMAHERARALTATLLERVTLPTDLVACELVLLWNPQNLREHLMPDIMVALAVGEMDPAYGILRRQYRSWDERKMPDLILEFASPSTVGRDNLGKKEDYARLGIREYVQFDPLEESFKPGLKVYRLQRGTYQVVPPEADGAVPSLVVTDYEWLQVGLYLRLRERMSKRLVPSDEEARASAEEARAQAEEARAQAEEARASAEEARAQAEEARAQAEEAQAREAVRASAAEDEVARLQAEIARLRAARE